MIARWIVAVGMAAGSVCGWAQGSAVVAKPAGPKPLMLVTWFGPGAVELPAGGDWKPDLLTVYDKGRRPVAQFVNKGTGLTASFILYENLSGKPGAAGCREDGIDPILKNEGKLLSKVMRGEAVAADGQALATASWELDMSAAQAGAHQPNLFAFAGDAKTCAEVHLSSVSAGTDALKAALTLFKPVLGYQPVAIDFFRIGTILYKNAPELAAPYYKSALDATPKGADTLTARRVITDQLVMSLGRSGDLANSRAVAEKAITDDPEYPMNYYNLACADAEEGKAAEARENLQSAFERRSHVLKGERLPDPTQDDSLMKLKSDQAFWAFVETLPKQ